MNKQRIALALWTLMSLLWSCTEQDIPGDDALQDATRRICFRSATLDDAFTRGALLTSSTLNDFKVSARMTRTSDNGTYYIFQDETNTRPSSDNSSWQYASGNIYYWPGSDWTLDFYAVAPATASVSYADDNTRNAFTYTTPSSPADQVDLMVAQQTGVAGDANSAVSLSFSHLCAAVEFSIGNSDTFDGSIDEITVSGIANQATYSYATGSWSTPSGSASFSMNPASGNSFGDSQRFVLLPQELADDAQLQIKYTLNGESQQRTYTYSLKGQSWSAATCYRYALSLAPQMTISFSETTLDAHYVMTTATITVAGTTSDWSIVASGSSGSESVSLQLESEVNNYAKQGYWTADSRGCDSISGKGSGTYTVRIFAPENVTDEQRTYTFAFHSGGKTFTTNTELKQSCPDWTGSYGWEKKDDGAGKYGFKRSKVSVYVMQYDIVSIGDESYFNAKYCLTYLENTIMPKYSGSSEYVTEGEKYQFSYVPRFLLSYDRYYFYITYANIPSNIKDLDSTTNGAANTNNMRTKDITADICDLETEVQNTTASDVSIIAINAVAPYALASSSSKDLNAPVSQVSEDPAACASGILDCVLKKNAYNIASGSPELIELKWYIPAKDQNACPSGMNAGDYWSSTTAEKNTSYLLSGAMADRDESHSVRAIRNR
jgi:hypothetical protein